MLVSVMHLSFIFSNSNFSSYLEIDNLLHIYERELDTFDLLPATAVLIHINTHLLLLAWHEVIKLRNLK